MKVWDKLHASETDNVKYINTIGTGVTISFVHSLWLELLVTVHGRLAARPLLWLFHYDAFGPSSSHGEYICLYVIATLRRQNRELEAQIAHARGAYLLLSPSALGKSLVP